MRKETEGGDKVGDGATVIVQSSSAQKVFTKADMIKKTQAAKMTSSVEIEEKVKLKTATKQIQEMVRETEKGTTLATGFTDPRKLHYKNMTNARELAQNKVSRPISGAKKAKTDRLLLTTLDPTVVAFRPDISHINKEDYPPPKGGFECFLEETNAKVEKRMGFINKKIEVNFKMQ